MLLNVNCLSPGIVISRRRNSFRGEFSGSEFRYQICFSFRSFEYYNSLIRFSVSRSYGARTMNKVEEYGIFSARSAVLAYAEGNLLYEK